jgi:DGQHR domain-containing protein
MEAKVFGHLVEYRSYSGFVTPPVARDLFFVSTYDSTDPASNAVNKHGYQRPPTTARYKEIGEYFRQNPEKITPLILSVRISDRTDIDRFLKLFDAGDVARIKQVYGDKMVSIVDGQHRNYGILDGWEKDDQFSPRIPVMLHFGLTFVEEAELFNTINVTQRKLPKALIETTRGDITEADDRTYAQAIRQITFSLCRDTDSVWGPKNGSEQINMTGVRDPNRQVTYEGLRRSTSNMFPKPLLDRLTAIDEALPLKYAKRYWLRVSEACKEAWNEEPATRPVLDENGQVREEKIKYRIKDLVGVASLAKLGEDIIKSHIDSGKTDKLEELVTKLEDVDWEKRPNNPWMRSQAGFAGQRELYEALHALVYSDARPAAVPLGAAVPDVDEVEVA